MKRRWFQIHLSTAIVMMFVAAGLLWANLVAHPGRGSTLGVRYYYGFPLTVLRVWGEGDWEVQKFDLATNVVFCFLALVGIAFVSELVVRNLESDGLSMVSPRGAFDEALRWPLELEYPSPGQKVMMGFPLFGLDLKAFRGFRQQVANRSDQWTAAWQQDETTLKLRDELSKILKDEMEWPNQKFHPDDPCRILLFDPTMNMLAECAYMEIEKLAGVEIDGNALLKMTMGDLVNHVATARGREAHKP